MTQHRNPFTTPGAAQLPKLRSLAFDTAPDGYAWGVVERRAPRRFAYVDSGYMTGLQPDEIVREARYLYQAQAPDLLAIEGFGGFLSAARIGRMRTTIDISDLLQSAFVAGMLLSALPNPQQTVVLPANGANGDIKQWRYWLTGSYKQGDKGVAQALDALLIDGLPRRGRRKGGTPIYALNDHRRDAVGLAVAAWLYADYTGGAAK